MLIIWLNKDIRPFYSSCNHYALRPRHNTFQQIVWTLEYKDHPHRYVVYHHRLCSYQTTSIPLPSVSKTFPYNIVCRLSNLISIFFKSAPLSSVRFWKMTLRFWNDDCHWCFFYIFKRSNSCTGWYFCGVGIPSGVASTVTLSSSTPDSESTTATESVKHSLTGIACSKTENKFDGFVLFSHRKSHLLIIWFHCQSQPNPIKTLVWREMVAP